MAAGAHAWVSYFHFVYVCVLTVFKISQKILGRKFGPKDKRWEKIFRVAITPKWSELDMQLLLDTNRKPYMMSPLAPLDLTLTLTFQGHM